MSYRPPETVWEVAPREPRWEPPGRTISAAAVRVRTAGATFAQRMDGSARPRRSFGYLRIRRFGQPNPAPYRLQAAVRCTRDIRGMNLQRLDHRPDGSQGQCGSRWKIADSL